MFTSHRASFLTAVNSGWSNKMRKSDNCDTIIIIIIIAAAAAAVGGDIRVPQTVQKIKEPPAYPKHQKYGMKHVK